VDAVTLRTGNLEGFDVDGYRVVGVVLSPDTITLAVLGSNCDWAAYDGPRTRGKEYPSHVVNVLRNGRKLRREEALAAFPLLNPERWRK
jgi:hypothetical protein